MYRSKIKIQHRRTVSSSWGGDKLIGTGVSSKDEGPLHSQLTDHLLRVVLPSTEVDATVCSGNDETIV